MSVGSGTPYNIHTGTGLATVFGFSFTLLDENDLVVTVDGAFTSAYTVSGVGIPSGGSITFVSAPANGAVVVLRRVIDLVRATDYQNNGDLLAPTLNDDFDRLWMAVQQIQTGNERSVRAPFPDALSELPAAASRAGRMPAFDSVTGDAGVTSFTTTQVASAIAAAYAAGSTADAVEHMPDGDGATPRSVQQQLRLTINMADFMTAEQIADGMSCTAALDATATLQAAIDHAYTSVILQATFDDYGWQSRGGATVVLPYGKWLLTGQITLRPNVSLKGAGKSSTAFYSTYNGSIFVAAAATKSGEYNPAGITLADFMVIGDKTKASQRALDLHRPVGLKIRGMVINSCGSDGARFREVSNSLIEDLEVADCAGKGVVWKSGDTGYPSNANTMLNCRLLFNDGNGLSCEEQVNGLTVIGGSIERNGYASGGVGHYNISITSNSYQPVHLIDVWTEGPCEAHIYMNTPSSGGLLRIDGWRHFGDGSASLPGRALIIDSGTAIVTQATGSAVSYKSIAGSTAPFRVNKTNGVLYLIDSTGSLATGLGHVEDETGAQTGLYNCLRQDNFGLQYGPRVLYNDNGADDGLEGRTDTLPNHPWFRFSAFRKALMFGSGSATPDAGIERKGVGTLGPMAGDYFAAERVSTDRGDASVTLVMGTDEVVQRFATTLTSNRTVTLPTTNVVNGSRFKVVRTGLGAFTLDVGGLKTIASATAAWVEVTHDGTAWRLTGYGTL